MLNKVCVNIWDDYCEDEDCETSLYVEEFDGLNSEEKLVILMNLRKIINQLRIKDVRAHWPSDEGEYITLSGLTHKKRENLVERLNKLNLRWFSIPFLFYSES